MDGILHNKLKIISSPFYLGIKFLSIPEAFFWIIFSSISVSKKPPLRVWLSMRMLHFLTCEWSTKFAINLTQSINKTFNSSTNYISASTYISANPVLSSPVVCNELPICDYISDLNETGSAFIGHLRPELLNKVTQIFESSDFYEDIPRQYTVKQNKYSAMNTGRLFIKPSDLLCHDLIKQISAHRLFLDLCLFYFGLPPILYQVNGWSSNYIENQDPCLLRKINKWNARYPHIDFACLKFFKVFIFLDSVNDDDVPFHYWQNSNSHNCRFTSDGRYDYSDINSIFGNPVKFVSSSPGSIFIADTSNYHCDGIVSPCGSRRTLQFEYCFPGLRQPNQFEPSISL